MENTFLSERKGEDKLLKNILKILFFVEVYRILCLMNYAKQKSIERHAVLHAGILDVVELEQYV